MWIVLLDNNGFGYWDGVGVVLGILEGGDKKSKNNK